MRRTDVLPADLAGHGVEKANLEAFSKYDRTAWGQIRAEN